MNNTIDNFRSLSEKEQVRLKKEVLLKFIRSGGISNYEEVANGIQVDNDTMYDLSGEVDLKNCFFIDTNGEAYAVVAPHELGNYIVDYMLHSHEHYSYTFEQISNLSGISSDDVEQYFLTNVLLRDGTVVKNENGTYSVSGHKIDVFLTDNNKSIKDYIDGHVDYMLSIKNEEVLLMEDYSKIDGFYVFFIG